MCGEKNMDPGAHIHGQEQIIVPKPRFPYLLTD